MSTLRVPVISMCYTTEPLLSCGIPYLQKYQHKIYRESAETYKYNKLAVECEKYRIFEY